jgi:hypothetical protein
MPRKENTDPFDDLTISEPLSVTLRDGTIIHGTLWMHASKCGRFEVEYDGRRHSDYRTDYIGEGHMRGIARIILAEMAEHR